MSKKNKYICIHGHFYQPPRENAWLEVIELQDSATPFHDWNERINFECYAPNATARILDDKGKIIKIVNNYAHISFNFGPTLLSWLEEKDPTTYQAILDADKESMERFGGHGSAMAQVYNHLIMPLANKRDKATQIIWGIEDFKSRFGRHPEGIWLAETAVDTETLELLVENGIKFTVLAPRQGKAIRKKGSPHWHQLGHATIDPRRPYEYKLPSGKSIALFFYDGNVSQSIAFEGILKNGKNLAYRMAGTLDGSDSPQIAHVATDGESYGHHHRHGEMALASCIYEIQEKNLGQLTNYGQYLELFPPDYEVQIHENSSWSCVHGVERWRSNCGCHTGGEGHWHQRWRAPLRATLDWIRDKAQPIYEEKASEYLNDIWAARDGYIHVLMSRNEATRNDFFEKYAKRNLNDEEKTTVLRMMEMQRHAMLMYTSCGWFFNEVSGIETDQILQYANRVIYYARQVGGVKLHDEFIKRLRSIPSNVNENGAVSYEKNVVPTRVDLVRVGMHYAASSLFKEYPSEHEFYNYKAISEASDREKAGVYRLNLGKMVVKSNVTLSEKHFSYAVLYLGQQNIIGHICVDMSRERFDKAWKDIKRDFHTTDLGRTIVTMENHFQSKHFTIWHLFRDEKRSILQDITKKSFATAENMFREVYNDNYQLMLGMLRSNIPIPEAYTSTLEFVLNRDLNRFFEKSFLDIEELEDAVEELKRWKVKISDEASFKLTAEDRIFYEIRKMAFSKIPVEDLVLLNKILEILFRLEIKLDVWKAQNLYFSILKGFKSKKRRYQNKEWKKAFLKLGELLNVNVR